MDKLTRIHQKLDSKISLLRRVRNVLPRIERLISRAEKKLYAQWIKSFRFFVNVDDDEDDDRQRSHSDQELYSISSFSSSSSPYSSEDSAS